MLDFFFKVGKKSYSGGRVPEGSPQSPNGLEVRGAKQAAIYLWFPIFFIELYLLMTVLFFAFGPWQWPVNNEFELYAFLCLVQISLGIGYFIGAKKTILPTVRELSFRSLLQWSLLGNMFFIPLTIYFRTDQWFPSLVSGFSDPGNAYDNSVQLFARGANAPIEYVRFFVGPLLCMATPLGVFFWSELTKIYKLFVVMCIGFTAYMYIAGGINKAFADLTILLPWLVIASIAAGVLRLSAGKILIASVVTTAIFASFLYFFSNGMATRGGGATSAVNGVFTPVDATVDYDNFLIRDRPNEVQIGIIGLNMYLTGGYQALSMSLEEPFVPCFGVGNSFFLTKQAERLTGIDDLHTKSYPARLEKRGWDSIGLWSSIYPWLASDITFPGVLVVVALIGYGFARTWKDAIYTKNPFAVTLNAYFIIMLFYFPANNQVFQFGEGISSFIVMFIIWRWSKHSQRVFNLKFV